MSVQPTMDSPAGRVRSAVVYLTGVRSRLKAMDVEVEGSRADSSTGTHLINGGRVEAGFGCCERTCVMDDA